MHEARYIIQVFHAINCLPGLDALRVGNEPRVGIDPLGFNDVRGTAQDSNELVRRSLVHVFSLIRL